MARLKGTQMALEDDSAEYREFVEKFQPRKTTDDCYTPEAVYEAVAEWVSAEYDIGRESMVRPFWPGGDYEREDYPEGCVVVDNPPFSILSRIVRFYNGRGVRYFLFAPSLTNFQARDCSHVIPACDVTYENGAVVRTAFVTNVDPECKVRTAPALRAAISAAQRAGAKLPLPRYTYPDHVLTAAAVQRLAAHGVDYRLRFGDGFCRISAMDAQKAAGKTVFGGGYLLSDGAATARAEAEAAADRAKAEAAGLASIKNGDVVWELSERERKLVGMLGGGGNG